MEGLHASMHEALSSAKTVNEKRYASGFTITKIKWSLQGQPNSTNWSIYILETTIPQVWYLLIILIQSKFVNV